MRPLAAPEEISAAPDAVDPNAPQAAPAVRGMLRLAWYPVTSRVEGWRHRLAERLPIGRLVHEALLRQFTRRRPPIGLLVLPLLLVLAAATWSGPAAASPGCYRYGEVVTLSGQYFASVAPVDDGIVRDPINDAARRATLLTLASPFCVDADIVSRSVADALTIQLYCPALHPADGSALSVEGRLLGAHTRNGQTPVLLMCL